MSDINDKDSESKPTKLTYDDVILMGNESIKKKESVIVEAIKEAVAEITKESFEKIRQACSKIIKKQYKRFVEIYTFEFVEDKTAIYDRNGKKVIFNGVRLSNIIKYNYDQFINELNSFFNEPNDNKFYCYYRFFRESDKTKWSIFVAWTEIEKKDDTYTSKKKYVNKNKMIDVTNKELDK
jgi:hypothetical protein